MKRLYWLIGVAGLLLAESRVNAAAPPVEAFGRTPEVGSIALSPNGKLVAWEDNRGPRPVVLVIELEARKHRGSFPIAEGTRLRSVRWSDDATILIELSMTQAITVNRKHKEEWFRTLAVDVASGNSRILLMQDAQAGGELVTAADLLAARSSKPSTVIMATLDWAPTAGRSAAGTRIAGRRQDSRWVYSLFSVDTRTGRGSTLEYGTQFTSHWVLDATGQPVARSEWEPANRRYTVLAKDGARWRSIHTRENADPLRIAGLTPDGNAVLAAGTNGHSTSKAWSIPLSGSGAQVFFEDPDGDVSSFLFDPTTKAPVAVLGGPSTDTLWLDKKAESRHKAVARAFPGRNVHIVGRSDDYQRVLAEAESPSHPPTYYLIDFTTGNADIVGEAYPGLANAKLGEVRSISYRARDGASIPAYVTLPVGVGERNLPLVVLPHGGPESRDRFEFHWWAQFLASRGYAVLQPQFRGSTGFGEAHRKAGYRQWGGLMQDDVTDGVKHLIDQGLADARRICIVGLSYGGYAALAGAAFTPELYACAASINGISDLPILVGYAETRIDEESDEAYYWRDHIGEKTDPKVVSKSPARAAEAIRAPVLLMHGMDDTVVPILQSQRMHEALTALRRPVKFVKLPGEDHWLSASQTRVQMLTELEGFLAEHLGGSTLAARDGAQ